MLAYPGTGPSVQVPSVNVENIIAETIASCGGKLTRDPVEAAGVAGAFSLQSGLFIPGVKHLIDNVIGDVLAKLDHFESFQSNLKTCTELWT